MNNILCIIRDEERVNSLQIRQMQIYLKYIFKKHRWKLDVNDAIAFHQNAKLAIHRMIVQIVLGHTVIVGQKITKTCNLLKLIHNNMKENAELSN